MRIIVGVRVERAGPVYYFDGTGLDLHLNDYVVVDMEARLRVGRIVVAPGQLLINQLKKPAPPVMRLATEEDLRQADSRGPRP